MPFLQSHVTIHNYITPSIPTHPLELPKEDMQLEALPYDLTPNPLYAPVYDTVKEPFKIYKPQPPRAGSMYTETLSRNKQANLPGSGYEDLIPHYKGEVEDCYVHMQPSNK